MKISKCFPAIFAMLTTVSSLSAKTLDDQFLFSTVFITNESTLSQGTGFVVIRPVQEKKYLWCLVSNKHILLPKPIKPDETNRLAKGKISINTIRNGKVEKEEIKVILRDAAGNSLVKGHPSPFVDVAAMIITSYLKPYIHDANTLVFAIKEERFATRDFIRNSFVSVGDPALIIGYPLSLVEEGHVVPIARNARLATKPDYDFKNQPIFLVDSTVVRGSSGSPVVLPIQPYVWTEKHKISIGPIQQNHLLGIVSGAIKDWEMIIRKSVSFEKTQVFSVIDSSNLGIVFRAETISETIDEFGYHRWSERGVEPSGEPDKK